MMKRIYGPFVIAAAVLTAVVLAVPVQAQMKEVEKVTISGKLVDLSCAAKGMAMMGSNYNALNDTHKTPKGEMPSCGTMCLKGGQPAGLFSNGKVSAVLLANASLNLYKFALKDVDLQGFWAGSGKDDVKTFFPEKIRLKGTTQWTDVQAAEMH